MKKLFVKFLMLLFVLGMSTTAWAGGSFDTSQLPPEMLQTLANPTYCAQLTGRASSTGGGKVYVNAPQLNESSSDPRETEYVEGVSNVAVSGMGMSMAGMTKIGINAWAKADPGYWFAGFSFSNMGVDLGTTTDENMPGLYASTYDIGIQENETIEHVIYGTFEPIRFAGYEITGNTTTSDDGNGNRVCNLAVIFTPSGATVDIDASDFKTPVVSGAGWSLTSWDYNTTNAGKITVNVHFTTTSTAVAEYAGSLKLETQATPAISMNVPLNARTAASSEIEAIRYNKNKVKQGEGALAAMIAAAAPTDVIKLNKNYNGQVIATKSFTLDLNGYNIEYHYNTMREGEFDEAAIAQAALLVYDPNAVVTIAYSPYGGEIIAGPFNDAADVFGKLILNGGTLTGFFGIGSVGVVEQNGATINASPYSCCAIASKGKVTITDGKMNAMVGSMGDGSELIINGGIIDNTVIAEPLEGTPGYGVQIGGGVCRINKGTIIGRQYGVQNAGGEISIEKLAVIRGGDSYYALDCQDGTTTVNCGKFEDPTKLWDPSTIEERMGDGRAVFGSCYFLTNNPGEDAYFGQHVWRNTSGAEYRDGYEFFVGPSDAAKAAGVSVCHIGGVSYSALEDALAFANNTNEPVVIIMDNDYTLPAGYYTIPSNATLLIPMSNEQGAATAIVNRDRSYTTPSLFRKLTLANGVNIDVFGTIEVSGTQYSGDSNQEEGSHTGAVRGDYAQLQMNKGSKITMQNGSVLRAWGYVTGDIEHKDAQHNVPMGEIDVRRGATVYELFQLGDWGNTVMNGLGLVSGDSRFPITSYFIQNVEVPTKYHPGGRLTSVTSVSADGAGMQLTMCANEIQIVGVSRVDVAMFLMNQEDDAENTWVRKWYDASKDQQVYEVNSAAHIGNLVINLASSPLFEGLETTLAGMGGTWKTIGNLAQNMGAEFHQDLVMNSGQYVLPITSNFKLHLLSGTLDFTQSTELIPGSELEIDKEATVSVTDQHLDGVREGSLYIYDWRDWSSSAADGQPAQKILYTPAFDDGVNNGVVPDAVRDVSTCEALGHAKVNVHGTFDTYQGYIFTSENGGDIFSHVEDAGTFMFTSPALLNKAGTDSIEVVKLTTSFGGGGDTVNFYPAKLHNSAAYVANGGAEYQLTGGTKAGQSYCYSNFDGNGARWTMLEQRGCFTYDSANNTYYIKPQEYVAVSVSRAVYDDTEEIWIVEGNNDHTYSDAAGAGRLFINLGNPFEAVSCQWWEVEQKNNYYHCIHPENDTYYEWNETEEEWQEVKLTITWKDYDGTVLETYEVPYGTQAEWLSTNPTREPSDDYTYDFTGWSPALGKVTSDVTYMATYEEKQIKYTIVFVNDGGVEIERHLLARDEVPVCENAPTRTGYILQWSPNDPAPVTGNQTYTATWLPEPPETYTITFKNYNGNVLKKEDGSTDAIYTVEAGQDPEYDGATPTKDATSEYEYTFSGWKPAIAAASSNATYVAQFVEEPRQYEVKFYQADKETLIETQSIPYGGDPVIPSYTIPNTAQYTYSIQWKNVDGDDNIQSVTGNANYYAAVTPTTNKYNVKLISNPSGACTLAGNGIYEYGTEVTLAVDTVANYEFTGWSDGAQKSTHSENRYSRSIIVTSDTTIVANFTYKGEGIKYTIRWWNEDGTQPLVDPVVQQPNTNTIYPGATPTKDATAQYTFTFDGWATVANGARAYKKGMTPKATDNADYYAHFDTTVNTYEVALTASPVGAATFSGLGTYLYNENADAVTLTVIPNAGYTFTGWSDGQEGTNLVRHMAITDNIHLVANFTVNEPDYTITWKSEDGTQTLAEVGYKYKTPSTYTGETPTKAATAEYSFTFDGWTSEADGAGTYYANGATPKVMANATYFAHFVAVPVIADLVIGINASEDLDHADVERTNLVITSNGVDASGQLLGAENLSITGEAIFRLEQDFDAATWYAVAVPWTVALSGIRDNDGNAFASGNVYVIEFDASAYANADRDLGRTDYWKFLDETGNDMQPGKLYMIWFKYAQTPAVEFHKKEGASLWTTSTSVAPASGIASQSNWNAIANPALYHASMTIEDAYGDVLKYNGSDSYILASSTNMVVGQPIFAQVSSSSTVVATPVGGGSSPAPYHRAPQTATEANNRFVVELTHNGKLADRLIVQTAEEKANEYVIGKDLSKMSVSTKVAQMWMERYNTKLCKNTVEMNGEAVNYPLAISAPVAGEYIISNANVNANAGYALYLTQNGVVIANLSEGDYTLYLNGGTTHEYGLRIGARAPQTATGMDEAVVNAQGDIKKVLIDNKVFIIRGNHVYSVDGQLVK